MTRLPQAMSKAWHKIHIALPNQRKNPDKTLRPTSPIITGEKAIVPRPTTLGCAIL
jgi:hypothetical protein